MTKFTFQPVQNRRWRGWTQAPTCRVLTTSCILARPRSRKLSIRSPSMNPVACSVFRSVWKDLQVPRSQGKSIQGSCFARGSIFRYNIKYLTSGRRRLIYSVMKRRCNENSSVQRTTRLVEDNSEMKHSTGSAGKQGFKLQLNDVRLKNKVYIWNLLIKRVWYKPPLIYLDWKSNQTSSCPINSVSQVSN